MLKCEIDEKETRIEAKGKGLEISKDISRLIAGLLKGGVPINVLVTAVIAGIDAHFEDKKEVE